MKRLRYILPLFICLIKGHICLCQWPTTDPSYVITFGDEFSSTTGYNGYVIDTSKWIGWRPWNVDSSKVHLYYPDLGYVDQPGFNFNLQDTTNIHVYNGTCKLTARKGKFVSSYWNWNVPPYFFQDTFKYSNASLVSKQSLRFGYYELRFRLPGNVTIPNGYNAYQPTFWLFSQKPGIANHSEIDVFEIRGTNGDFTDGGYYQNASSTSPLNPWHQEGLATVTNGVWHTAAINWTKDKIDYYYDGNYIRTHTTYADSLQDMQVFIETYLPLFLPWNNTAIDPVNTVFPYTYEIDYIRVYQRKEACDTSKVYLTTTLSGFNSKLYKSLTLGGSGGNASFSGGTASALGTDYVLLAEGTSVDNTMSMYIDVLGCNPNKNVYVNKVETPPTNSYNYRNKNP